MILRYCAPSKKDATEQRTPPGFSQSSIIMRRRFVISFARAVSSLFGGNEARICFVTSSIDVVTYIRVSGDALISSFIVFARKPLVMKIGRASCRERG